MTPSRPARLPPLGAIALALLGAGGCGVPQTESCAAYEACAGHYADTFGVEAPDTTPYGPEGECWRSEAVAEACDDQCIEARAALGHALRISDEPEGACGG